MGKRSRQDAIDSKAPPPARNAPDGATPQLARGYPWLNFHARPQRRPHRIQCHLWHRSPNRCVHPYAGPFRAVGQFPRLPTGLWVRFSAHFPLLANRAAGNRLHKRSLRRSLCACLSHEARSSRATSTGLPSQSQTKQPPRSRARRPLAMSTERNHPRTWQPSPWDSWNLEFGRRAARRGGASQARQEKVRFQKGRLRRVGARRIGLDGA